MLGPVGKVAKAALVSAGYELTRPTPFERRLMLSYWEDWLSRDPLALGEIYLRNRQLLQSIPSWIDEAAMQKSLWRYGVPEDWENSARQLGQTSLSEAEPEITYSDLIAFIAWQIEPLRYLEIGVSVGKNFLQIVNQFPEAEIVGLDVEDINPAIASYFDRVEATWTGESQTVETLNETPATIHLTHYTLHKSGRKPVTYIKGDQFSPATWDSIDQRFNFVFSDGVHSGRAVRDEMDHLQRCDLLDMSGKFAMLWDDLVNIEMQSAFESNCRKLGIGRHGMHWIHGTYGNERLNGIWSNF